MLDGLQAWVFHKLPVIYWDVDAQPSRLYRQCPQKGQSSKWADHNERLKTMDGQQYIATGYNQDQQNGIAEH